jgi:hypothetical protein
MGHGLLIKYENNRAILVSNHQLGFDLRGDVRKGSKLKLANGETVFVFTKNIGKLEDYSKARTKKNPS